MHIFFFSFFFRQVEGDAKCGALYTLYTSLICPYTHPHVLTHPLYVLIHRWKVMRNAALYMSSKFIDLMVEFNADLYGVSEKNPRDRKVFISYIHAYIWTYIHTHIRAYIHAYICTYIHTYMHAYIDAYMHVCICTYIHAYIDTCMHVCIHACMHICMHARTHACMHAYIHSYAHTHVRTYTHTHMHKHTYTHTRA